MPTSTTLRTTRRPLAARTLAELVAADGFGPHEAAVRRWLATIRARDRSPVLIDIVADTEAPEVVRLRALGRLATEDDRPVPAARPLANTG